MALSDIQEAETLSTADSANKPKRSKFREWLNGSRPVAKVRSGSPGGDVSGSEGGEGGGYGTQSDTITNMTNSQEMQPQSMSRGRSPGRDGDQSVSEVSSEHPSSRGRSPGDDSVVDRRSQ